MDAPIVYVWDGVSATPMKKCWACGCMCELARASEKFYRHSRGGPPTSPTGWSKKCKDCQGKSDRAGITRM